MFLFITNGHIYNFSVASFRISLWCNSYQIIALYIFYEFLKNFHINKNWRWKLKLRTTFFAYCCLNGKNRPANNLGISMWIGTYRENEMGETSIRNYKLSGDEVLRSFNFCSIVSVLASFLLIVCLCSSCREKIIIANNKRGRYHKFSPK